MMIRSTKASSCVQIMLFLDLKVGYTNVFNWICVLHVCMCVCVKYFNKTLKKNSYISCLNAFENKLFKQLK